MDKIEKIKAEIKRLREIQCSPMLLCDDLLSFIDYIQEEPVSEDFEEQVKNLWKEVNTGHTYSIIGSYNIFYGLCLDIANWQKEQYEKERLKHYNELTPEQAQIVSDCVTQHFKNNNYTPTFIDAIEYGKKLQKEHLLCKVTGQELEN